MASSSQSISERGAGGQMLMQFVDAVLRGVGQVMFQNNPITGALFLLAILVNSFVAGTDLAGQNVNAIMLFVGAIVGTAVSTATAMLLGTDRGLVSAGLYGFNGTLVGIALPFFFQTTPLLIVYMIVAAACSTVLMSALLNAFGHWEVPALTAPFVLTTWLFMLGAWAFGGLQGSKFLGAPALPAVPAAAAALSFDAMWQGLLEGVGEVMFQLHWVAGIIFLVGIAVNSRISAVFALVGSLVGLVVGALLGANAGMLGAGLYGFNPVLTGIALGGVFYVLDMKSALYALLAMVVTTVVMGAMAALLAPVGMPALTWPFIMTTWFFIFAKPLFSKLRAIPPAQAGTPEANLKAAG